MLIGWEPHNYFIINDFAKTNKMAESKMTEIH